MSRNQIGPGSQVIKTISYILLSFSIFNLGLSDTMAKKYNVPLDPLKVFIAEFWR